MTRSNSTQIEQVLEFLKRGYKLNALIAHREFGLIGSTLAFHVFKLREQGWEIESELKTGFSGNKYAEYTLSPNWRLVSEEERRKKIAKENSKPKVFTLRDLKIGDRVKVVTESGNEFKGVVKALLAVGVPFLDSVVTKDAVVVDSDGEEGFGVVSVQSIIKKLRK